MRNLELRAATLVEQAREKRMVQLAGKVREVLPDADLATEQSALVVSGSNLRQRWLSDPNLRFLARLVR